MCACKSVNRARKMEYYHTIPYTISARRRCDRVERMKRRSAALEFLVAVIFKGTIVKCIPVPAVLHKHERDVILLEAHQQLQNNCKDGMNISCFDLLCNCYSCTSLYYDEAMFIRSRGQVSNVSHSRFGQSTFYYHKLAFFASL